MRRLPITVVILTYNEERAIGDCLDSVIPYFSEVIVLDSFSEDDTQTIATDKGVCVVQRVFDNYASQRNFGLNTIEKENEWVFFLDADERLSRDVVDELFNLIDNEALNNCSLYRLRRKDHFLGRWLRRTSGYPTWFGRLCKVGEVSVERAINEEYLTEGRVGLLKSHIMHFPFLKGVHHWVERHNKYSTMEAERLHQTETSITWKDIFNRDPGIRRIEHKKIFYSLPGRPFIGFIYLYLVRLGFLDGYPGFVFCLLRAYYEFLIGLKQAEKAHKRTN